MMVPYRISRYASFMITGHGQGRPRMVIYLFIGNTSKAVLRMHYYVEFELDAFFTNNVNICIDNDNSCIAEVTKVIDPDNRLKHSSDKYDSNIDKVHCTWLDEIKGDSTAT